MSEKTKLIGKRIKMIRIGKGLQQSVVAKALNISQAYLSNIENGRFNITVENLIKLQEILDCPVRDFFVDIDADYDKSVSGKYFSLEDLAVALSSLKK